MASVNDMTGARQRGFVWPFYVSAFLAAFLLFAVEPMLTKALLPGFGGSYLVWGAAMVFFQAMLFAGYAFVHVLTRRLGLRRYVWIHAACLALSVVFAPFALSLQPSPAGLPLFLDVFRQLFMLTSLPFLALSTMSVLLQKFLSASDLPQRRNPYVLYAASNLGSLLALVSYPVLIEPLWDLQRQTQLWWWSFAGLALLNLLCLPAARRMSELPAGRPSQAGPLPPLRQRLNWFLLSMAGCFMLLAVTNVLTFDIASVPLLWTLPLAVYLLTFVLVFKQHLWYPRVLRMLFPCVAILGIILHLKFLTHLAFPLWLMLVMQIGLLFLVCLHCNGRLALSRPADNPEHLTTYYLLIAFGGVIGGIAVNWIVPLLSSSLLEFPAALALAAAALALDESTPGIGAFWGDLRSDISNLRRFATAAIAGTVLLVAAAVFLVLIAFPASLNHAVRAPAAILFFTVGALLALILLAAARRTGWLAVCLTAIVLATPSAEDALAGAPVVRKLRNFYGVYRVFDLAGIRYLQHGTTLHGRQYMQGPKKAIPLSYYHETTGGGAVMKHSASNGIHSIGMVGLGTGALAGYAAAGQTFTIYELDPDGIAVAEECFSYLHQARRNGCRVRFVVGDGRLSLRAEPPRRFDLLILDAFSSDSIPVHLLTCEALVEYLRVLKPDGVILMHVSNKHLRLEPVVYSNARRVGVRAYSFSNRAGENPDADESTWVGLTRSRKARQEVLRGWTAKKYRDDELPRPWTDRYSNLLGQLAL